jgi:hypothetical protein
MATNPPIPIPEADTDRGESRLEETFKLAQALADRELASIDRLHSRTLRYIGYVIAFFVAGFGILGYVGYKNLQELAVGAATRQVKTEATRQVQLQLTKQGITEIVHEQTHDFVEGELRDQVHAEIMSGPLHREIIAIASAQSRELVAMVGPRHFTSAQAAKLREAIAARDDLAGYPVTIRPYELDFEAVRYMQEIRAGLATTKLAAGNSSVFANSPASEGVVIFYDENAGEHYARLLAEAFSAAEVTAKVESSRLTPSTPLGGKPPLLVFIGPRLVAEHHYQ